MEYANSSPKELKGIISDLIIYSDNLVERDENNLFEIDCLKKLVNIKQNEIDDLNKQIKDLKFQNETTKSKLETAVDKTKQDNEKWFKDRYFLSITYLSATAMLLTTMVFVVIELLKNN